MAENYDIVIIGSGPAGLGAATSAAKQKLSHVLIEKAEIANTIYDYQLRKHVMAEPSKLPLRANAPFVAGSRESVLEAWNNALTDCSVNLQKRDVSRIQKTGSAGFEIYCGKDLFCACKHVVLAMGVQGSPRTLGVPGENLPHVAYTLADPDAFEGKNIVVVGAGDAGIENALALAEKNRVSLVNRSDSFPRVKDGNVALVESALRQGKLQVYYSTNVIKVEPETLYLNTPNGEIAVPCNHLIIRAGAIPPRKFLEQCGIKFPGADLSSVPAVSKRYESNVEGLYLLGALIGYPLIKQALNQGHEVIEHILGNPIEPADQVLVDEKLGKLGGDVNEQFVMIRNSLPLFNDLSDPQFRELIIDSTVHITKPGEVVFERNDYTQTFFSVISGAVEIEIPARGGIQVSSGQYFGEMGLLSGRRRTATVRVKDAGLLLETPRNQILKLISSVESVKRAIDEKFVRNALQTSIFPEVDPKFLAVVAAKAKTKTFNKGEVLFKEGEAGDVLYVIRKGSVKVARRNAQGVDVTQTYIAAGNYVGEMALLSEETQPRTATVTATVKCETIVIDKSDFLDVLRSSDEARKRITQLAEKRRVENLTRKQDVKAGQLLDFMLREGVSDADNVLMIDSDLCVGCDNCESACAATHGGYTRLDRKAGKSFASIQIPISCRHCENPLCMLDCPPDALTRTPDGEVIIKDSCIGCGNCKHNCPYGVIQMIYDKPHHGGFSHLGGFSLLEMFGLGSHKAKEKGPAKAGKCDMCRDLPGGPSCVRACPTGAAMRVNPSKLVELVASKQGARA